MTQPAVVFVPPSDMEDGVTAQDVTDCIAHSSRRGYDVQEVIRGDWDRLRAAVARGCIVIYASSRRQNPRVEFVGDDTRRITRNLDATAGETRDVGWRVPSRVIFPTLDDEPVGLTLIGATLGAALVWLVLQLAHLESEGPIYALVWAILAAWIPFLGWRIERAWNEDMVEAEACGRAVGFELGRREGYGNGYVDAVSIRGDGDD